MDLDIYLGTMKNVLSNTLGEWPFINNVLKYPKEIY